MIMIKTFIFLFLKKCVLLFERFVVVTSLFFFFFLRIRTTLRHYKTSGFFFQRENVFKIVHLME